MPETKRWQDWVSFALALWLAVSPWLADYAAHDAATANAAVCGLALALVAHFCASCDYLSTEWFNLLGGLWLVASPFLLGFTVHPMAAGNAIVVGAFITLLSAWALGLDRELRLLWQRLITVISAH